MNKDSKIFIAGANGMVGSAIVRQLIDGGYNNLLTPTSKELNLVDQKACSYFFELEKPEFVFLAAAKVGGILANNTYPADFLYNNLMIETNTIHSAYKYGVKKLLFLGSSCIYPKFAELPLKEESLLSGHLEPTNEAYAIAKIAGIKLCQYYRRQYNCDFISAMPTNLYGINDNFDLETSHLLPALMRKFHEGKENQSETVELWGTGKPKRELLFVDDLANAALFLMNNYSEESHINVGTGKDIEVNELAKQIKKIIGFKGGIVHNTSKPDGTPRKVMDVSKIKNLGWSPKVELEEGIKIVYDWYLMNK